MILVGVSEIATRAGVGRAAVCNWVRRHDDFPAPLAKLKAGSVWDWAEVAVWLTRHNRNERVVLQAKRDELAARLATIDATLATPPLTGSVN